MVTFFQLNNTDSFDSKKKIYVNFRSALEIAIMYMQPLHVGMPMSRERVLSDLDPRFFTPTFDPVLHMLVRPKNMMGLVYAPSI